MMVNVKRFAESQNVNRSLLRKAKTDATVKNGVDMNVEIQLQLV